MAVLRGRCGHSILPLWFIVSFFFPSPILSGRRLDVFEFRMHAWNVRHAPRWKYSTQKSPKIRDLRTITQLCLARPISSQLRHVSTIGKRLLNSNISSTCPLKMVNVSPLTAEIGSVSSELRGTPSKLKQVSRLGVVTAPTSLNGGQPNWASYSTVKTGESLKCVIIFLCCP